MIPCRPKLGAPPENQSICVRDRGDEHDIVPSILLRLSGGNGAFGCTVRTIVLTGVELTDAMKM